MIACKILLNTFVGIQPLQPRVYSFDLILNLSSIENYTFKLNTLQQLWRPELTVAWLIEVKSKDAIILVRMPTIKERFWLIHSAYIWCSLLQGFLRECWGRYSLFIYSPTVSKSGTKSNNLCFWCMFSSIPAHSAFSM